MLDLCKPSQYYLVFAVVGLVLTITFNVLIGAACGKIANTFTFMTQLLYIFFWTFVLNKICEKGYRNFSWFLFLLPLVSTSIVITITFMTVYLGIDIFKAVKKEAKDEKEEEEERKEEEATEEAEEEEVESFVNLKKFFKLQ